jgi:hypothetical protein
MTTTATKERPILFSGPMVRAIIAGAKSQTRRIVKLDGELRRRGCTTLDGARPDNSLAGHLKVVGPDDTRHRLYCSHGYQGDRLWVKETWHHEDTSCADHKCGQPTHIYHKATEVYPESIRWRPSIFMQRWASRITLEIEQVRVERLKEITEADAIAEGVDFVSLDDVRRQATWSRRQDFAQLWDRLNKKRGYGWETNPWVWVIEFRKVS